MVLVIHGNGPARQMNEPDSALPLPKRRWAAISIATGLVVTILDGSMVIVMLPVIAETFSVEPSRAIWVMTAYQLTMTCLLLQSAAIGEKYGQWRVYCSGLALFACASLVCAFSTSLSGLIFGRVLQGIGAAGVHSMTMALLRHSYPRSLFGRAAGFNSSVVGLSMAAGPSVGALILHFTDWRGLFLVTFPVAAFSLIAGLGALPRLGRPHLRVDLVSGAIATLATVSLFMALNEMRAGTNVAMLGGYLAASVVLFAVLVRRQRGVPNPVLPVDLLSVKVISFSLAASVCVFASQGLTLISLPFHLSHVTDLSPAVIGLLITPWPVGVAAIATIAGRLSDRYSARILCALAAAILFLGLLLLFLLPDNPNPWDVSWRMLICGIGFGLFTTPNNRTAMLNAPLERASASGALLATARLAGQALGATVAAIAFSYWPAQGAIAAISIAMGLTLLALSLSLLRQIV